MAKNLILILLLSFLSLVGCKEGADYSVSSDGVITLNPNVLEGLDVKSIMNKKTDLLPPFDQFITKEFIGEALNIDPDGLLVRPMSRRENNRSCYYKYEDFTYPNAGIRLEIMENPIPEQYPEYVIGFVDQKIHMGEKDMNPDLEPVYYKKIEGLGNSGAYSTDLGKYYWRLSDKVLFYLAFNTSHTPDEQIAIAMKIGKTITQSYLNLD